MQPSNIHFYLFHGFLGTYEEWIPFMNHLFYKYKQAQIHFISLYEKFSLEKSQGFNVGIGYSLGGRVLNQISRANPHFFSHLIFISSTFSIDSSLLPSRLNKENRWKEQIHSNYNYFVENWYRENQLLFGPICYHPQYQLLLENKKKLNPQKIMNVLNDYSVTRFANVNNYKANIPSLYLAGEWDPLYSNLGYTLIPKSYHMCYFDNLTGVMKEIDNFLKN